MHICVRTRQTPLVKSSARECVFGHAGAASLAQRGHALHASGTQHPSVLFADVFASHSAQLGMNTGSARPWCHFHVVSKGAVHACRAKSILAQPIQAHNGDKVYGVIVAVNKREQAGESDIFFEPFFTDPDWCVPCGRACAGASLSLSALPCAHCVRALCGVLHACVCCNQHPTHHLPSLVQLPPHVCGACVHTACAMQSAGCCISMVARQAPSALPYTCTCVHTHMRARLIPLKAARSQALPGALGALLCCCAAAAMQWASLRMSWAT